MDEHEVLTMLTRPTTSAMYAALRAKCRETLGAEPPREALLVLLAHWAVETATGAMSRNHNVASLRWARGCGQDFTRYATREIVNGDEVQVQRAFRAYNSLEDGVSDYINKLTRERLMGWQVSPAAFAHQLKASDPKWAALLHAQYAVLDIRIGPDTLRDVAELLPTESDPDSPTR